jgi:DNA-binding MarR family transcriptional regulator
MSARSFNRFLLLRELTHAEVLVFFELNRRTSIVGNSCLRVPIWTLAEVCNLSERSVHNALKALASRKLILVEGGRPKRIKVLYDLTLALRREEREL